MLSGESRFRARRFAPAPTYTFELADPDASRHIRVSENDTYKPIALFMTIPTECLEAPGENVVVSPARAPQAIQAWFHPGDWTGEEFVYPKTEAATIEGQPPAGAGDRGPERQRLGNRADETDAFERSRACERTR